MNTSAANINVKRKKRVLYFDVLKVISIYFMMCLHISAYAIRELDVTSFEWLQGTLVNSSCRWCVPVFVMVSGALILNPSRTYSIKKLWKGNILRLLVAYLVWSAIYLAISVYEKNLWGMEIGGIDQLFSQFLIGEYHMWFMLMIITLYALSPALRLITKEPQVLKYIVVVCLVIMVFDGYASVIGGDVDPAATLRRNMHVSFGYIGYFLLGYLLSTFEYKRWNIPVAACLLLAGYAITAIGTVFTSTEAGWFVGTFCSNFSLNVALMAVGLFMLVRGLCQGFEQREEGKVAHAIHTLGTLSLGAYLVHVVILEVLGLGPLGGTFPSAFLWSVPVAAVSFAIAFGLRKIPRIGTYLA